MSTPLTAGVSPEIVGFQARAAVIDALGSIPRHLFVPDERQMIAYTDRSISIGSGRRCPRPAVVARLLDACSRVEGSTLVIGVGTGYVAACVAELSTRVVAVETNPELATLAACALAHVRVRDRITLRTALGSVHSADGERFDAIVLCGSLDRSPRELLAWLRPGGALIAPLRVKSDTTLISFQGAARGHVRRELGVIDVEPLPEPAY